jgi:hypothetical protein
LAFDGGKGQILNIARSGKRQDFVFKREKAGVEDTCYNFLFAT